MILLPQVTLLPMVASGIDFDFKKHIPPPITCVLTYPTSLWQIYRISRRIIEATEKRCADVQELPAQFSVPISGGGLCLKT